MDLLKDNIGKLYARFLLTSFGSTLISSIYGLVDAAMVGRYHGPDGSAAMAVVSPMWNIIYSLGLLAAIGGSVLYAVARGRGETSANRYFTASVTMAGIISVLLVAVLYAFEEPLLRLFGATDSLLPLCKDYLLSLKPSVPVYVFICIFSSFLRNDSDPARATKAVLAGGIFNVFGDYFFVFTLDMGIKGAGIATAMGASVSLIVLATHFFSKKNTLRFERDRHIFSSCGRIIYNGFSSFIVDIAMGVLTILFNRSILQYLNTDALAVYGVIVSVSTFVQCCAYGVGQASQPILSQNYGANLFDRIRLLLKYNVITCAVIGVLWTALTMLLPTAFIRLFMTPTENVLLIAPGIMRVYALSFLLLPFNVYASYYCQSTLDSPGSMTVSVFRGILLSGALIIVLPLVFGGDSVWWAMPVTELLVAVFASVRMHLRLKRAQKGVQSA